MRERRGGRERERERHVTHIEALGGLDAEQVKDNEETR